MADWLFESGGCALQHNFGRREVVRFADETLSGSMEQVQVFRGIWLHRGEATGDNRFKIDIPGGSQGQGRVILGAMLSGRGVMTLEGCEERSWRDDGRIYALSPIERNMRYEVSVENDWRAIAVRLETEALDLLGSDPGLPGEVRDVLTCRRDDLSEVGALSGTLRAVSHNLMRSPYEGSMRVLYRQAKVLEMLMHLFDGFGRGDSVVELSAIDHARVRLARERLLEDLGRPPNLETLALEVGLSPKRLNRCFRQVYGTTVFDYLRDARLDAARAALEADTPLSLKQLAWELGYAQVSNFVTAFRRRFGLTPGAYRRVRVESE